MTHSKTRVARTIWLGTSCLFTAALVASASARAGGLPNGGVVVGGSATISNPSGNSTVINQATDKAIINWQDFSIATGNSVTFNQLGANSIALNRVVGSTPSTINGDLFANGHVWLINGNGVLFGKGAQVNVGSLIATTADIDNQNFMQGDYKFGTASGNRNAGIINNGIIRANNGSVILAGPVVSNNGVIQADLGNVTLGGVSTFSVDFQGDNLLRFQVGAPVQQTPVDANGHPVKALVSNTGTISAKGGRVVMTTRAAESVVDNVINNTGMVEATSVSMKDGEIILDAGDGTVEVGGTLNASGTDAGEKGGSITVAARTINVADGATLDASGDQGGGSIRIGGDAHGNGSMPHAQTTTVGNATLKADAITRGDGGSVVVWSDGQTTFAGSISAKGGALGGNGGFVETSGHHLDIAQSATVSTYASSGLTGTWLLDPDVIQIVDGGDTELGNDGHLALDDDPESTDFIDPDTIIAALGSTNVTLEAVREIDVLSNLIYNSPNTLSLLSQGDVHVNANVQNTQGSGGGAINVIAGWDGITPPSSDLTAEGVYGNGFSVVFIGGEGSLNASIGSASGLVTVAGTEVHLDALDSRYAQIGYHGAGGGDIHVVSGGDIDVISDGGFAHIGNGATDVDIAGNITGNITIHTGNTTGALHLTDNSEGGDPGPSQGPDNSGPVWVGNVAGTGAIESGNLTIIGSVDDEHLAGSFGLTDMIVAALGSSNVAGSGGDVEIALFGNSIDLLNDIFYDSSHNLSLLSVYGIRIEASVQNAGTGDLTVIAGWDGVTLDPAHFGDAGVYGNAENFGSIGFGQEDGSDVVHNIAFGTKGGTTLVEGQDVSLGNPNGYSQIGYHGAATGDIIVRAAEDLTLIGGNAPGRDSVIGHGATGDAITGNVSGDIDITVAGLTTLQFGGDHGPGGLAWIGNRASSGFKATGDITLTTGQVTAYGANEEEETPNTLADIILANIGTSDDTGGNFTLALTDPNTDYLAASINRALNYNSPHSLTIMSTGNLTVANDIQNAGTGAVTLLGGWDSSVAANNALGRSAYGLNGKFVWIVGANEALTDFDPDSAGTYTVASGLGTSVGSKDGAVFVGGAQVYVEGLSGYAQIGYHGDGGSGSIDVVANGTPGTGGLTGINSCFDALANICVIGGRQNMNNGNPSWAQIGNLGLGVTGTSSADITVTATGNIAVAGGGIYADGSDPLLADAYGLIGSGDATGRTDQTVGGSISVTAGGSLNFASSDADGSIAWLGNITGEGGTHAGDVTIVAASLHDGSAVSRLNDMLIADLGAGDGDGGNVTVALTGDLTIAQSLLYNSTNTLSFLSAGDITVGSGIQNSGAGAVNVVAGWDGETLDTQHLVDDGVFGNNGGSVTIDGTNDGVAAGSAGGLTTVAGDNVSVLGGNVFAMIGTIGGGNGDIALHAVSDVTVDSGSGFAQIGNGGFAEGTHNVSGDIDIVAGSVDVTANGDGTFAHIGNGGAGWAGDATGNIDIALSSDSPSENAGRLHLSVLGSNTSSAQVGNGGVGADGNFTGDITITGARVLAETSAAGYIQIGNGGTFSSGNASGDITVTLADDEAGNSAFVLDAGSDNSIISVGNGGYLANSDPAQGFTYTGDINVTASDISLGTSGNHASVLVGNGGTVGQSDSGSGPIEGSVLFGGNITLHALDTLTMDAAGTGSNVLVGNGGANALFNTDVTGSVTVGGNISLIAGTQQQAGAMNVNASTAGATVQIGNGQRGFGGGATATDGISTTGDITVHVFGGNNHSGAATFNAVSNSLIAIGNGGRDAGPALSGGNVGGDILINVDGNLSMLGEGGTAALIGNMAGSAGTATGDATVIAYDASGLEASIGTVLPVGDFTIEILDPNAQFTLARDVAYNSANRLMILSKGDINVASSVQNAGGGAIDVIAGWDGTTLAPADLTDEGVFGNNDGSVTVGGSAATGNARIGSRHGLTTVAGADVDLEANNGDAQIGYHNTADGTIRVIAADDVILGSNLAGAVAQIGNGGRTITGNILGDINVSAGDAITVFAGDNATAMIGVLGAGGASQNGRITLDAGGALTLQSRTNGLALVGNAALGQTATGTASGDIDISAGNLNILAENAAAVSQIGNGRNNASATGDITVESGAVILSAEGAQSVAHIGHGVLAQNATVTGDVILNATGPVSLMTTGDNSDALIGSTADGDIDGDVTVATTGTNAITLSAGADNSRARIGSVSSRGDNTGDTSVTAGGAIVVLAGGDNSRAAITSEGQTVTGNILVQSLTSQIALSGSGEGSTAQIGAVGTASVNGSITVSATDGETGTVQLLGAGVDSNTLIGSYIAGDEAGTVTGGIHVIADSLSLYSAAGNANAQIGHGLSGSATGAVDGDIAVDANGAMLFATGAGSLARIGHVVDAGDGTITGDIGVHVNGYVQMLTGFPTSTDASSVVIGSQGSGDVDGDIAVTATSHGGAILVTSSGTGSTIGIGNTSGANSSGDISVIADSTVGLQAADTDTSVTIGSVGETQSGSILVQSNANNVVLQTEGEGSLVQIGARATTSVNAPITVTAHNLVNIVAHGANSDALIGSTILLGEGVSGTIAGNIAISAQDLTVSATGEDTTAQIGSGLMGTRAATINSNIAVNVGSATLLGSGDGSMARIGHHPAGQTGSANGDIVVNASGDVLLTATGEQSNAIIGSGASGDIDGDIHVTTTGDGDVTLTSDGNNAQTRIGNAGRTVTGDTSVSAANDILLHANGVSSAAHIMTQGNSVTGNIFAEARNGTVLLDSEGANSTTRIGATGFQSVNSNVTVQANGETDGETDGGVQLVANGADSKAIIGSSLIATQDTQSGSVAGSVSVTTSHTLSLLASNNGATAQVGDTGPGGANISVHAHDLTLNGSEGENAHALIGNGGFNQTGNVTGNIDIRVGDMTELLGEQRRAWIGNVSANGTVQGSLVLVSGDIEEDGILRDLLVANLQSGDVTLGLTAAKDPVGPDENVAYDSSHTFNLLSTGDIVFGGSLQNSGSGDINIVAGWNGETIDPESFGGDRVFGNEGHGVTIGLPEQSEANGVAVGSREGDTHVFGGFLSLSATRGYAQLGYHGGGQGSLFVRTLGDVTLTGGNSDGFFAQIGNGGRQTEGFSSGEVSVLAGGDVTLNGGEGDEAYVQIGHGGAESNTDAQEYANTGLITVHGENVTLNAGSGDASYVQIGHGGYKVGAGLTGSSDNSGDIGVTADHAVTLHSGGNDAYAQIGHGGDQMNTNAGANAHGTISGNIVVSAPNGENGTVDMIAGEGTNAYVQIGNGGYSINAPTAAIADNFTIGGNVTVSDLVLHGGAGDHSFAMIGNGDNAKASVGNVSGDIFINTEGGSVTLTDGTGQGSKAAIHNATGTGTVSGKVTGFQDGPGDGDIITSPEVKGVIVSLIDNKPPTPPVNNPLPDIILSNELPVDTGTGKVAENNPIEEMTGGDAEEKPSDKASQSIADSLNGGKKSFSQVLLGGMLKQQNQGGQSTKPHAVPAADEDYSSWGNEALWQ